MIWVVLVLSAACALAYWVVCAEDWFGWTRSATKTASVAGLALIGGLSGAPGLVVTGLAFGAAGDFFLSRPGERAFLAGMGAFAVGHLAYVALFAAQAVGLPHPMPALAMIALAVSTEIWLTPRTGALRWPVRGYVAIISAMALAAMALPPGHAITQTGAALFVASDLLLAVHVFLHPHRWLALALWPAYWGGQALILWGSLA